MLPKLFSRLVVARVQARMVQQQRRCVSKLRDTADQALEGLSLDGATIAVGGFGPCGVPETLIDALERNESAKNLTLVAVDVGTENRGVGKLITAGTTKMLFGSIRSIPNE